MIAKRVTKKSLVPALQRGTALLHKTIQATAPEHTGELKKAHIIRRDDDQLVVTIDPRSEAAIYGQFVHDGVQNRGRNPWMDVGLKKSEKRVERILREDVSKKIDQLI